VLIVADETAPAARVAADPPAQAEHDPGSAVLATNCSDLTEALAAALARSGPPLGAW